MSIFCINRKIGKLQLFGELGVLQRMRRGETNFLQGVGKS